MDSQQFERLEVGDDVRHVVSGTVYRVTSHVTPFHPRFRKVSKKGRVQGEVRTFLPENIDCLSEFNSRTVVK